MNVVSVGAVNGARAAYEIHAPSSNQEINQVSRKSNNDASRQRSTSNLRAPLSNLPAGRKGLNEHGQTQQRTLNHGSEEKGLSTAMVKNGNAAVGQENLYKYNTSHGNLSNADSDDIPENMYRPEKAEELEGWIHREKLAKIENEELQAAGINLAKARSKSKDPLGGRGWTTSRDRLRNDFSANEGNTGDEKRRKVSSPIPAQPSEDDAYEGTNWDLRTPEEILSDQSSQPYTTPVLRKTGSKIPVLSPTLSPVTPESDLPRKRAASSAAEEGLNPPRARTASSKMAGDSEGSPQINASGTNSPVKMRQKSISGTSGIPASTKQTSTSRKPSLTSRTNPTSSTGRPRTRGNDMDRPRTANHPPEGDPPWLADMYKPDPRLPPDQQLIPTLAKKQRQMQWEEDGAIPKTYDRDFSPLAVHENLERHPPQEPMEQDVSVEQTEEPDAWPLKPMPVRHPLQSNVRQDAGNSPPATGGYSTMPKVSSPPMSVSSPQVGSNPNSNLNVNQGAPSPNIGPSRAASASQQQQQQQSQRVQQRPLPDDEDEKAQEKGCTCCLVM